MGYPKKALHFSILIVLGVGISGCSVSSAKHLNGAGATFPAKIYVRWFSELAKTGGPQVNYQSVGSGSGRKALVDQTVNFAASDDPMQPEDISKINRGVVQIPMIGGTIAFGYNWDCDLQLTQLQAVQVAIGKINNWQQLGCPAGKMTWVHRSDGAGTTKALTSSLQAFSNEWTLGSAKSVNWPAGVGSKGNSGVAGVIKNTPGTIGYVNQSYINGNIKAAAVQNKSGEFIHPNYDSGSITLNAIKLDENLAGSNPNPIAKGAYPIATLTWLLAYKTGNGEHLQPIKTAFEYMLSDQSQAQADDLGFVPLKGILLEKARSAINLITE